MAFRTNPAPYMRAKKSTTQIMLILLAALGIVWLCAVAYSFKLDSIIKAANQKSAYGLRAILLMVVAVLVTALCDVCTTICKHKVGKGSLKEEIINDLKYNYSYVTAAIFTLTLPVYTPVYVVIVGSVFATVVVKNLFGGFGKNVFNPAAMARIFVALCFSSALAVPSTIASIGAGVDAVSGATITTAFNNASSWLATSANSGFSIIEGRVVAGYSALDILLGNYLGAMGETFTLVILALGVALSVLKVINWRTPVFYLGTVALTALVIALVCGFSSPLLYVVYHLSLGGLVFGAVFMLTDPVTGPTGQFGKAFIGVVAGLLTVLIRIKGGYPEGVVYSIAICNLISPAIDYLTKGRSNDNLVKKYSLLSGGVVLSIVLCTLIGFNVNGGKEVSTINGFYAGEYTYLTENVTLQEGHKLEKVEGYTSKTGKLATEAQLATGGYTGLSNCYAVKDANGNLVANIYLVYNAGEVVVEGYPNTIRTFALVGIKTDGSIYSCTIMNQICTNTFPVADINSEAHDLTDAQYNDPNYTITTTQATYSTKILKDIIATAKAEMGGN